ncbi:hypothetical protein PQR71_16765 [Paraburkholderia fungorum]|uniref:hypothetical protein n=1 Tax=Paraburkholderia fungorum TaxID=134537 RepID=UPI0038BB5DF7
MALRGTAFISIWHDLADGYAQQFERWHTEEHMPERLGVPGFLRGRRYINWEQSPHVCFTLYELAHLETFRSPGYLARLNAPTEWSNQVQPGMTNFLRGVCETQLSAGLGTSGALATFRIRRSAQRTAAVNGRVDPAFDLQAVAVSVRSIGGIVAAHLGAHRLAWANATTGETELRPPPSEEAFEHVLLVEAIDLATLKREHAAIEQRLRDAGASHIESGCYQLGYELSAP